MEPQEPKQSVQFNWEPNPTLETKDAIQKANAQKKIKISKEHKKKTHHKKDSVEDDTSSKPLLSGGNAKKRSAEKDAAEKLMTQQKAGRTLKLIQDANILEFNNEPRRSQLDDPMMQYQAAHIGLLSRIQIDIKIIADT